MGSATGTPSSPSRRRTPSGCEGAPEGSPSGAGPGRLNRRALGGRPAARLGAALAALLLLLPVAAPAAGQGAERLRESFSPQISGRMEAIADRAERDGIPRRLVLDKALEGAAKGASGEQVLTALSEWVDQLRAARGLVGRAAAPDVLVAAVEALRRGAGRQDIRALGSARPDLPMALLLLGDLAEEGVPGGAARALVEEALAAGWRGDGLLSLSAAVRREVRGGAAPREAAETVRARIRAGDLRP